MMPAGAAFPDDLLKKADAFLQVRFPDLRCTLAAGRKNGDQGFVAIPMEAAKPGTQKFTLSFQGLAQLNDITDALGEFRVNGWKRQMN